MLALSARIQPLLRGHRYGYRGFYFLILADYRMIIYLPEGCALAGSENLFIFGEIWGSIGRLRLAVGLVFVSLD